jgi:tRNA A-37 threonylcarbamoyl transferase component Bud32
MSEAALPDPVGTALEAYTAGEISLAALAANLQQHLGDGRIARPTVDAALSEALQRGVFTHDAFRRLLTMLGSAAPFAPTARRGADAEETRIRDPEQTRMRAAPVPRLRAVGPTQQRAEMEDPHEWSGVWGIEVDVGDVLSSRYRLEKKLGEGGMGIVFLAVDTEDKNRPFAVKVLQRDFRRDPLMVKLLEEEVDKGRKLTHPNIVAVYLLMRHETVLYILMQYLEGKTLEQLLTDDFARGMPLQRAEPLIHGAGAALAYAHDSGVIHADLKPANIFVTTAGIPKVLDFGIARAVRGTEGAIRDLDAMTEAYASCEMLEGQKPDVRDDIYAFACVAYELLSGHHPFEAAPRRRATEARDRKLKPKPVPGLSTQQNRALERALCFDREQRTDSIEAFLTSFKSRERRPPWRRVPFWAAVVAVAALAGVWLFRERLFAPGPDEQFVASLVHPLSPRSPDYDAQRVTDEMRAASDYLEAARKQFDPGVLSRGVSTAYGAYQDVLALDPSNRAAAEGVLAVLRMYRQEARRLADQGQKGPALEIVQYGLDVNPSDPPLLTLKQSLEK